ncbi:nucleoside 2-deoxyribosyltransferase [Candidatus Micrarchaeota archaeon]|nr:nucleoside 2-deoxyribosyltransferase [Candidatus Micrarchaeota archaeon]MBU1929918.1 nucleoside 2-deoxyribosyltransferase [Candidatus Micrarchaeota archaeon]
MKVYFAGSITGGMEFAKQYEQLNDFLKTKAIVLTEHLGSGKISDQGEQLEADYIFKRDTDWIKESDLLIAEVSTPSLGVGYEIALAEQVGTPIVCLYNKKSLKRLSGMIRGNKKITLIYYETIEEAIQELKKVLA